MPLSSAAPTLGKKERISSRTLIEKLFNGDNSHAMSAYPLRLVYMLQEDTDDVGVKILISVSKRHFKRAVKRNRVKRQIRESYRHNKQILLDALTERQNGNMALAFIWLADNLFDSEEIDRKMRNLLERLSEKI
jgi:ribonuclease P protein component